MAITLRLDGEGFFLLGQALQEQEYSGRSTSYLDLENGGLVAFEDEELKKIKDEMGLRYIEIPCTSHAELHQLMDKFVWSLENKDAKRAAEASSQTLLDILIGL